MAARVVEVIADRGESAHPRYRYGSGCIVVGRIVLTAAHVVVGAETVRVRDPNKVMHAATLDERFVGDADGTGPDLALVDLDSSTADLPAISLGIVDRESPEAEPVERCHAVGYPWFAERPSPDMVRDTVDAYGHVPVLSRLASGLLSLHVSGPPRPLPAESVALGESEWAGMSGAPLVAAGCLLGVVTEHAPREGPGTITITPLTALEPDPARPGWGPGVPDASLWWSRLGVADTGALRRLPAPRVRREPAYRAAVREIQTRTRELRGRKDEVGEIAGFATSSQGYRWLTGGVWTGKTALIAAAIAALPDEVKVIAYFLSRVEADADSSRFLGAVVPQLADLLGQDPPVADPRDQFRALWERACSAEAASGRHVLLVVDGLDEDLHPAGSPSVAALLPPSAGGRAHVLVSSRSSFELPSDVPVAHPLHSTRRAKLKAFAGAAKLAALARQEIDDLKRRDDDGLATDVLAILTAAAGPVTVEDLATLTTDVRPVSAAHRRDVRRLVTEDAARSVEPIGSAMTPRYQFAHQSLLEYAETDQDLGDPEYRQRIHKWAKEWATVGWPHRTAKAAGTPRYLLDAYPATLAADARREASREDLERLVALVCDLGWLDTAVARVGVDAVLSSLRTAAQLNSGNASARTILELLEREAHHLRRANVTNQQGYAATALAWRAIRLRVYDVTTAASELLRRLPPPQLVPVWTTERTSPSLISVVGRHDGPVRTVAVGGEGLVVSGGDDGTVRLWDPHTPDDPGRELGRHDGPVRTVAVSGEGFVVSGGLDATVRLWEPHTPDDPGRELGRHDGAVLAVAVSGVGRVVSAGLDGAVRLWDPHTPDDPGRELGRHDGPVRTIAISREGRFVSGGMDGAVRLWDPHAPDDPGRELGRYDSAVLAVAVSSEGHVVSAGTDGTVRLWDPHAPDDPGRELGRHARPVFAVAVSGEGLIVSGGDDGTVRLWDPHTPGQPGRELGRHGRPVFAVAVSGDRFVLSGGTDGTVRLWDPHIPDNPRRELGQYDGPVRTVAASGPSGVVSGGDDGTIRLWDPHTPDDPGRELGRHDGPVRTVAASREGPVASGGNDGTVRLWDPHATASDHGRKLGRHDGPVRTVAVSREGPVVSGGDDGTVRLWDPHATAGDHGRELGRHDGPVRTVAVNREGLVLSGGNDGSVRLWDPHTPDDPGRELGRHDGPVRTVAVSGEGLVLSGGNDGAVRLWYQRTPGHPGRELGRHDGPVLAVVVTAQGLVLSSGDDGTVRLWHPSTRSDPGHELGRNDGPVLAMAVTRDRRLSVGTPDGITAFEMITTSPQSKV